MMSTFLRQFDNSNYVFTIQAGTVFVMMKRFTFFPHLENVIFYRLVNIIDSLDEIIVQSRNSRLIFDIN